MCTTLETQSEFNKTSKAQLTPPKVTQLIYIVYQIIKTEQNQQFSPQSVKKIASVLNAPLDSHKANARCVKDDTYQRT